MKPITMKFTVHAGNIFVGTLYTNRITGEHAFFPVRKFIPPMVKTQARLYLAQYKALRFKRAQP